MAMFTDPRAQERDNQNSLRKFPFSDAASCTNGACVIPPGAIVDAQLYVPGREPGRVWMSSVGADGVLRFSDGLGEFARTSAPATADSAVPVVFTGDGGPCPGGVVVFGRDSAVAALRSCGGQAFAEDQAELAPAAVAWPGLPGVCGFILDDGHVVYGDVKMRGENGCVVATYVENGVGKLRISAVGRTVAQSAVTGFVTRVVVHSDNRHFVVSGRDASGHVVDVLATGAEMTQADGLVADRDDLCAQVRKTVGAVPSERAAGGTDCVCTEEGAYPYTVTLVQDGTTLGTETVLQGGEIGRLSSPIPSATGQRFTGYFDENGRMYYRPDGTGVGRFTAGRDVTVYAGFMAAESSVEVDFDGYGTLHLAAPDTDDGYANPIRISGNPSPVPSVREVTPSELLQGGEDAVADILLHPSVPSGEVHIGLRGLGKASMI